MLAQKKSFLFPFSWYINAFEASISLFILSQKGFLFQIKEYHLETFIFILKDSNLGINIAFILFLVRTVNQIPHDA